MTRTKYIGLDVHHASIAVVPIFGSVMEDLRQRKYRRSELSLQQFKLLSATSALAVGAAIRYKAMVKSWSGWAFLLAAQRK